MDIKTALRLVKATLRLVLSRKLPRPVVRLAARPDAQSPLDVAVTIDGWIYLWPVPGHWRGLVLLPDGHPFDNPCSRAESGVLRVARDLEHILTWAVQQQAHQMAHVAYQMACAEEGVPPHDHDRPHPRNGTGPHPRPFGTPSNN